MNKLYKISFACIIISLSALCSFFVTQYSNDLIIGHLYRTSEVYRIFSHLSSTFASLIPLILFLFLYGTTDLMINSFFEKYIERSDLFLITGVSFIPFLIYQYFLWYNIITYCNNAVIKTAEDFYSIKCSFNLSFSDIVSIGSMCWILLYSILILLLIKKSKSYIEPIASAIGPSLVVYIVFLIADLS